MVQVTVQSAKALYDSVMTVVDSMLYSREQRFNRQRNQEFRRLHEQGQATSEEILRAEFGGEMPHGLDIRHVPDLICKFHDLRDHESYKDLSAREQMKKMATTAGRSDFAENIYLHPHTVAGRDHMRGKMSDFALTFSHEHIHRLQGAEKQTGWLSSISNVNASFLVMLAPEYGVRDQVKNLCRTFSRTVTDFQLPWKENPFGLVKSYLGHETEIQARMHEAMSAGYASWQKLPSTKVELWASLESLGLDIPASVRRNLRTDEGRQARRDFRVSNNARETISHTVEQLNKVQRYAVFSEDKERFWDKALPGIYGNLIELYGDTEGRARMGMGTNPYPAKQILTAASSEEPVTPEQARDLIMNLPPQLSDQLLTALMARNADEDVFNGNDQLIAQALFEHDDTRQALFENSSRYTEAVIATPAAWNSAIQTGDTKVLGLYIEHGFDFTETSFVNAYVPNETTVFDFFAHYQVIKERLDEVRDLGDNSKLLKHFNARSLRANLEDLQQNLETSLQYILDNAKDVDTEITLTADQGRFQERSFSQSLRQAGESVGLYPLADSVLFLTASERTDDTAHL